MATPAKRPREENNDQNNVNADLKTLSSLCTNRANAFLKWFSSNDDNFFSGKVCN